VGRDVGEAMGGAALGVAVTDDPLEAFAKAQAVIDFTAPAATVEFAALAAQARAVHVIGTTGMEAAHLAKIDAAAHHAVIVRAGNMSLGVNLLAVLVELGVRSLGPAFDCEVLEMHHRMKVDAPSGTALLLADAAATRARRGAFDRPLFLGSLRALVEAGARVRIVNRSPDRAQALADDLGPSVEVMPAFEALDGAVLVINALSVQPDLDFAAVAPGTVMMDMTYKPLATPFLTAARARGLPTVDGLAMLIGQAAPSFQALFRRQPPPLDLRALLTAHLGEAP
jgi:hypothetical protein